MQSHLKCFYIGADDPCGETTSDLKFEDSSVFEYII
jgi:hypothetical protein